MPGFRALLGSGGGGSSSNNNSKNESMAIMQPSGSSSSSTAQEWEWEREAERQLGNSKGIIPIGSSNLDGAKAGQLEKLQGGGFKPRSEKAKRYFEAIEKLTPNQMLQKFAQTAPPNVQAAVQSTVMSIMGSLPAYAMDAALVTTSSKLANLIYQMQMTGYLLKNAEYRVSLTRSLKGLPRLPPSAQIKGVGEAGGAGAEGTNLNLMGGMVNALAEGNKYTGNVTLTNVQSGYRQEMNVGELTEALKGEIEALRQELTLIRSEREVQLRDNLLTYIQALPEKELARLTSDMSSDVMETVEMLVSALMEKLGLAPGAPETRFAPQGQGQGQGGMGGSIGAGGGPLGGTINGGTVPGLMAGDVLVQQARRTHIYSRIKKFHKLTRTHTCR